MNWKPRCQLILNMSIFLMHLSGFLTHQNSGMMTQNRKNGMKKWICQCPGVSGQLTCFPALSPYLWIFTELNGMTLFIQIPKAMRNLLLPDDLLKSQALIPRIRFAYLFITPKYIIPLCAGVFYDPSPAEGCPDDFFGLSIGSGIGWKKFNFDVAYQYRFGNNTGNSMLKQWNLSQDVKEHMVYSSVVIHF